MLLIVLLEYSNLEKEHSLTVAIKPLHGSPTIATLNDAYRYHKNYKYGYEV